MRAIFRVQDAITRTGYMIGAAALCGIVLAYLVEVVMRYFLNAPTAWSASAVAYLLCVSAMLGMPELARTRGHVAIAILEERLPPALRARHLTLVCATTGLVCALAAWMIWNETARQWNADVTTAFALRIPKAWLSAFMCYGFTNAALYYLRGAVAPGSLPWDDDARREI